MNIKINLDLDALFEIEDYDIHSAASKIIQEEIERVLREEVRNHLTRNPRIIEIASKLENKIIQLAFEGVKEES